jgi:type VI protein secretion system component VasA
MPTSERTAGARLTDRERTRIVQLYTRKRNPLSMRQIGDAVGVSFGSVHRVLATAGVPIRGRGIRLTAKG